MTREGQKEKVERKLNSIFSKEEKNMYSLINVESRKDKLLFRMPKDVISLDGIWHKIKEVCIELKIAAVQSDMYATVTELDDVLGEVKWLWKHWLPKGFVTMLVGDPGIGKSMLVLALVKIITSGTEFPTEPNPEKPSNVVWIDTEASQQLLRIRARKMNLDRDRIYIPVVDGDLLGQIDVMNEEHQELIMDMIDNVMPALIVLDSLGGSHTRGENKFEEIAPIMKFFALVARDKNVAVLMTHHLNKGSPGDTTEIGLYRIRGSTAIPQFSRSIMAMEKLKETEIRLRMIKSNLSRKAEPLAIVPILDAEGDIIDIQYKAYKEPPAKRTKQEFCATWVMEQLKCHPEGMRLKDLIESGDSEGFTRGNMYSAKTYLAERVLVKGTGKEAYWHYNNGNADTDSINQIIKAKNNKEK